MISRYLILMVAFLSLSALAEPPTGDVPKNDNPTAKNEPAAAQSQPAAEKGPSLVDKAKGWLQRRGNDADHVYQNYLKPAYQNGVRPAVTAVRDRTSRAYQNYVPERVRKGIESCNFKKLAIYAGTPVALAGAGLLYYNWGYDPGEWEDQGTEGMPSMVPKVGNEFAVEERIASISFPRKRTMWVHNGKKGFGKIHVEGDQIQYWNGNELIAESGLIAPLGRPFSKDIPVKTKIRDGSGAVIGYVEEEGEEVDDDVYSVAYVVKDRTGTIIGRTEEFQENGLGQAKKSPWAVSMANDGVPVGDVIRKGRIKNSYHWKLTGAEQSVDPRLLVILSAYKSYVDEKRGEQ